MSLQENADVDLLTAILNLADPEDGRHVRRIQALGERLSTYMESREHHMSGELTAMGQDLLTIMRTMATLGQRVQDLEDTLDDWSDAASDVAPPVPEQVDESETIDVLNQRNYEQNQQIQAMSRIIADQAERIQGLSATVVELMDRLQALEDQSTTSE